MGVAEGEFWDLTPYRFGLKHDERLRALTESNLRTGWFAARFRLEEKLQGPQAYIKQFLDPVDPKEAEAQAEAMFTRMAGDWGLEVQPLSE